MFKNYINVLSIIFLSLIINYGCNHKSGTSINSVESSPITLEKQHDSLYHLIYKKDSLKDIWKINHQVYQFQTGDIDENGVEDIMVGVIKATRYDPEIGKRLHIFKIHQGYIRPLWLGSRLGQPLVDFRFIKNKKGSYIRSIEKEKSGKFLVAEYQWHSFGLEFKLYKEKEISYFRSLILLYSD